MLRGDAARRRGGLSDSGRALDPPRYAARRAHDPPADPRPRRVRAARPPDGGDRRADPPSRLRPTALLRGARLPPGSHAHRPGTLLLHVLHVPRPADALPRGPFRPARGARQRRRPGAPPGAREDRRAAAAGWSGRCSTGTHPRSASTRSSARSSGASGSSLVSPARRSAASRAAASDEVSRRQVGRGDTIEALNPAWRLSRGGA